MSETPLGLGPEAPETLSVAVLLGLVDELVVVHVGVGEGPTKLPLLAEGVVAQNPEREGEIVVGFAPGDLLVGR